MPTQLSAPACALLTLVLFSCNTKKEKAAISDGRSNHVQYRDIATVITGEPIDVGLYNTGFMDSKTQHFSVAHKKVTVITAKGKLKIKVDPSALEKENGSAVDGKIKVSIIELTNSNDLFKSNAATISDGRLLASGGSYFIGMECNGQKLRIKEGRSIEVNFPLLVKDKMELFYGERDNAGNMNWNRAGMNLEPEQQEAFGLVESNRDYNDFPVVPVMNGFFGIGSKLYKTLNEEVYYYNKKMTLKELVDTINRYTKKVYIDTVYSWPKELANLPKGTRVDSNYLRQVYGPMHQFFLKTFKRVQEEKEILARQKAKRDSLIGNWQPQSLAGQIQKYYSPSSVTALGWINCDRFLRSGEPTDVEAELPYSFANSRIQYFILFSSFNGLMNVTPDPVQDKKIFRSLPAGQKVILVGFAKINGQIFHCRQEFTIQKGKPVQLDFKNVSADEMEKMFGKNVRI